MKRLVLSVFFALFAVVIAAQNRVAGVVTDEENRPLEFVTVSAFRGENYVTGVTTDENGLFAFPDSLDIMELEASCIGYKSKRTSLSGGAIAIRLQSESIELKEVTVRSRYINRYADRIVMSVSGNPLARGKSLQELLQTAPGVWCTGNMLSVYGQQGTKVYVNDRELNLSGSQLTDYLRAVPAHMVARIEIIPHPGAEYGEDSSGGIINIILLKQRDNGMTGAAGLSLTGGPKETQISPNFNLSLHQNKITLNLFGSANGTPYDRWTTKETSSNAQTDGSISGTSRARRKSVSGNIAAGLFYDINKRNTIGAEIEYLPNKDWTKTRSNSLLYGEETVSTNGIYRDTERNHNMSARLSYTLELDTLGSAFKILSNYNRQNDVVHENNRMAQTAKADSLYAVHNANRYNVVATEARIEERFSPQTQLNVGIKYTLNDINNLSENSYLQGNNWTENTSYDYFGKYRENILAAYTAISAQLKRWSVKAGLRYVYFHMALQGVISKHTSTFYPDASISYKLNERGDYSVALSYYRSISRPTFHSMDPTVRQISDYSYETGNPKLMPGYTNGASIDFILANNYTVAAGVSQTTDVIHQMFTYNSEFPERMYFTWGNDGKARNFFVHADGNTQITSQWSLYLNATYIITDQKSGAPSSTFTASSLMFSANTAYQLPHDWTAALDISLMTRYKTGNITVNPSFEPATSITKKLGNWDLSLRADRLSQARYKVRVVSDNYNRLRDTKTFMTFTFRAVCRFSSGKQFKQRRAERTIDPSRFSKD